VVANRLGARKAAMVASGIGFGGLALISQAGHLSGQLLVTGVRLLPRRPSLGPVLPFVSITVGQAVGSPVAGWAIERHDYVEAFGAFAVLAGLAAGSARLYPLPARVIMAQRVADSPAQA